MDPARMGRPRSAATLLLTREESRMLDGGSGPVAAKIMRTVVRYAEALGAERLVPITGSGHLVITCALPGIAPSLEMLDELVAAGLRTDLPFTLDPPPPLDFDEWFLDAGQISALKTMYVGQAAHMERMLDLGLRSAEACTCTPYLPQVGNVPRRGDVLAWSESACVVFANSALGARSNRNGAIMDLLCNIVGRVPLSGLLTDEGRRATQHVEVATSSLPAPQVLGAAIGHRVVADVPYITGLDRWLVSPAERSTADYLHELGAAAATAGAVGLYHVEGVTPEAVDQGTDLLTPDASFHRIDDRILADLEAGLPVLWDDPEAAPEKCFVGCPHLSLEQLGWWADALLGGLRLRGRARVSVPTTLSAAPSVLDEFERVGSHGDALREAGVRLSPGCAMQLFDDGLSDGEPIVTNSYKLRSYTHARFFRDEEIVRILVGG